MCTWQVGIFLSNVHLKEQGKNTEYLQAWQCSCNFVLMLPPPPPTPESIRIVTDGTLCTVVSMYLASFSNWTSFDTGRRLLISQEFVEELAKELFWLYSWRTCLSLLSLKASYYTFSSKVDELDLGSYLESTLNCSVTKRNPSVPALL